jgi:ElaB/YqjD/DUF883 family membrane-anchored ribosome-binding protein
MSKASKKPNRTSTKSAPRISYRILDDVLAVASTLVRSRKDFGAEKLNTLAAATRNYAASMTDLPNLKSHVENASNTIEELSEYMVHTDIDNMVRDAGSFVRRHPYTTLGLTIVAGLGASRMLRKSEETPAPKPRARVAKKNTAKQGGRTRKATNGSAHADA